MAGAEEFRTVTLLLDGIQSHYEIGQIFRLGEAYGVRRVVICGIRFNVLSRRLAKTAKGAQHRVPYTESDDAFGVVKAAKDFGLYIIAATHTRSGLALRQMAAPFPALVVIRGEKRQRDRRIEDWADTTVNLNPGTRASLPSSMVAALLLESLK